MSKVYSFFLIVLMAPTSAQAYEPILDHQAMLYFNITFDVSQPKKLDNDFGIRFDRSFVEPRKTIMMNQLDDKPAILNLKLSNKGLKAFNINGNDYSYHVNDKYVYHGAEGGQAVSQPIPEAEEEPRRKIAIPFGVLVGLLIGATAMFQ